MFVLVNLVFLRFFHVSLFSGKLRCTQIKYLLFRVINGDSRSSYPEVFLEKGALIFCSKFTGEHLCRSVISIKLLCNFTEITLRHGWSSVNLLHVFRAPFTKDTSGWLLLKFLRLSLKDRTLK